VTNQIVIDLHEATPVVFVDGVQVGVKIDITFHREGGLQVRSLRLSGVPTEAEIAAAFRADDGKTATASAPHRERP
jgi:hypothetical protein